ncbi:MAG: gamma-glutamyltransferase [Henriciella sp.]|nr:gamma-glutamyltransferase [Henriciella sp.]
MRRSLSCIATIFALVSVPATVNAQDASGGQAVMSFDTRHHDVIAESGMVSAQDGIAAEVGRDILAQGGNAIDAAVATGFALAVTHPQAGNLGGGGFMLVHLAEDESVIAIDFRETAPAEATRDMYLDEQGNVDNKLAQYSRLSAGVPGTVMGLLDALEQYGTMSRSEVLQPAIRLAAEGFPVSYALANSLESNRETFLADESSVTYFLGRQAGDLLIQSDLAASLMRIEEGGVDGFYAGQTADLIIAEMQQGVGVMTLEDLANYKTVMRSPVKGQFRGHDIYAMSPPSAGGVHIIQMLNILGGYDLDADGHNSAAYLHKLIEAMRRAYADRSKYLGDPDFVDVPVGAITSMEYADRLRDTISLDAATRSTEVLPGAQLAAESPDTTHYSVIDRDGNAVAVTYTLNFSFGSGYSVDGAGFLLNNEMDDFSAKPGAPNGYGLIGGTANEIAPLKRPLSSMTPLIVKKDGEIVLVTGSPGGSTIITSVMQVVLNVVEWEMNLAEATHVPRLHHQWLPDLVFPEPGISIDTLNLLEEWGHIFPRDGDGKISRTVIGRVNSVGTRAGKIVGAADPRGPDSLAAGH